MSDRPKTLLEMAGASGQPPKWTDAALVLIDHQREYFDGNLVLPDAVPAVTEIARLLKLARDAGAPIIHVVHHGRPGGALFNPDGSGSAIIPGIERHDDEIQVVKGLPNAFANTDLAERLSGIGRRQLVVGGFMTHMCVSSTVRAALDLGLSATVVGAATATRDLPTLDGSTISARDLQRASLAELADRFALVVKDASVWN